MKFHRLMLVMLASALPFALAACESDPDVHVVNPPTSSTVVTPGSPSTVVVPEDD